MKSIKKYLNKVDLKNRSKVLAVLKDTIVNDVIKVNKLMLAYDMNIIEIIDDSSSDIIARKNIFVKNISKNFGMAPKICNEIFNDWCDMLDIKNESQYFDNDDCYELNGYKNDDKNNEDIVEDIKYLSTDCYWYSDKEYRVQFGFRKERDGKNFIYCCNLDIKIVNNQNKEIYNKTVFIHNDHYASWSKFPGQSELLGTIHIRKNEIEDGVSENGKIYLRFYNGDNVWSVDKEIDRLPLKDIFIITRNKYPIFVSDLVNKKYSQTDDKKDFLCNKWKGEIEDIKFEIARNVFNIVKFEIIFKLLKLKDSNSEIFVNYKIIRKKDNLIVQTGSFDFGLISEKEKKLITGSIFIPDLSLDDDYILEIGNF